MDNMDYYVDLGLGPSSSPEEIARAYRRLARQYHPDLNPDNTDAASRFKEINEAYQVLSDPEKRAQYDLQRAASHSPWSSEASPTGLTQDEQPGPYQHTIHVQVGSTGELSATMEKIAMEFANELQEALRDFGAELSSLSQTVRSDARNPRGPEGFSPPPPPPKGPEGFSPPPPPPNGRPPRQGRPPRNGKAPKP